MRKWKTTAAFLVQSGLMIIQANPNTSFTELPFGQLGFWSPLLILLWAWLSDRPLDVMAVARDALASKKKKQS